MWPQLGSEAVTGQGVVHAFSETGGIAVMGSAPTMAFFMIRTTALRVRSAAQSTPTSGALTACRMVHTCHNGASY